MHQLEFEVGQFVEVYNRRKRKCRLLWNRYV